MLEEWKFYERLEVFFGEAHGKEKVFLLLSLFSFTPRLKHEGEVGFFSSSTYQIREEKLDTFRCYINTLKGQDSLGFYAI